MTQNAKYEFLSTLLYTNISISIFKNYIFLREQWSLLLLITILDNYE